jgi:hypothetical protein
MLSLTPLDCTDLSCTMCQNSLKPRCTWCRVNQYCGYNTTCDSAAECPWLGTISRSRGSIEGGTSITITGSLFYPSNGTFGCQFNYSVIAPATYISSTEIECVSPNDTQGSVNLQVTYNGKQYFDTMQEEFTYYGT